MKACFCKLGGTAACRSCPNNPNYISTPESNLTNSNYNHRIEYCPICGKPVRYFGEITTEINPQCECNKSPLKEFQVSEVLNTICELLEANIKELEELKKKL